MVDRKSIDPFFKIGEPETKYNQELNLSFLQKMKLFFIIVVLIFNLHCVADTNLYSVTESDIYDVKHEMDKNKELIISLFAVLLCVKTFLIIVIIKQRIKIKKIKKAFLNNNLNPDFMNKNLDDYFLTEFNKQKQSSKIEELEKLEHILNRLYSTDNNIEYKKFADELLDNFEQNLGIKYHDASSFIFNNEKYIKDGLYRLSEEIDDGDMAEIVCPAWTVNNKVVIKGVIKPKG